MLVAREFSKSQEEMLRCAVEVGIRLTPGEKMNYLPSQEVKKLLSWDAEKYRQEV